MEEQKYIQEDEITLKELILKFQEYFGEVVRNWKIVFLITIPVVAYMFYKTYKTPITYPAALTFMINDDNGGAMGGLGGLAQSFGFGGGGGEYNLEKMLSLLKSRNIVQQALFEKVEYLGKEDYFANHIIDEYGYHKEWEESVMLNNFKYSNNNLSGFDRKENDVLKQLYIKIVGKENIEGILKSKINEDTGILSMEINSTNEIISIEFVKVLFEKLEKFYVDKTIEKQQKTFVIMSQKVDSIRQTLNSEQYRLLKFMDRNKNLSLRQYKAEELVLQREIQALGMAYGEALKNQEMADFTLRSKTPFVQIIDSPIAPILPSKSILSYIKNILLGSFLGTFLSIIFILGRTIFKDIMSEDT